MKVLNMKILKQYDLISPGDQQIHSLYPITPWCLPLKAYILHLHSPLSQLGRATRVDNLLIFIYLK